MTSREIEMTSAAAGSQVRSRFLTGGTTGRARARFEEPEEEEEEDSPASVAELNFSFRDGDLRYRPGSTKAAASMPVRFFLDSAFMLLGLWAVTVIMLVISGYGMYTHRLPYATVKGEVVKLPQMASDLACLPQGVLATDGYRRWFDASKKVDINLPTIEDGPHGVICLPDPDPLHVNNTPSPTCQIAYLEKKEFTVVSPDGHMKPSGWFIEIPADASIKIEGFRSVDYCDFQGHCVIAWTSDDIFLLAGAVGTLAPVARLGRKPNKEGLYTATGGRSTFEVVYDLVQVNAHPRFGGIVMRRDWNSAEITGSWVLPADALGDAVPRAICSTQDMLYVLHDYGRHISVFQV